MSVMIGWRVIFRVGSVAIVLVCGMAARGQEVGVFWPADYRHEEGPLLGPSPASGYRHQQVFATSQFEPLPATHRTIIGARLRPDVTVTSRRTVHYDDLKVEYSTTTRGPGGLSPVYADNIGPDVVGVFDGPVTVITGAIDQPGGPHIADYDYKYSTPFEYVPSSGRNLLIDFVTYSGTTESIDLDGYLASDDVFIISSANASTGQLSRFGMIFEFVYAPKAPGDYNGDRIVDAVDISVWQQNYGATGLEAYSPGDGDGNGAIAGSDFLVWQRRFGTIVPRLGDTDGGILVPHVSVPEPTGIAILLTLAVACAGRLRIKDRQLE